MSAELDRSEDRAERTGRDAVATKRALVRAARRRFATEGYRATTVRHIAADVGVNVSLINRYFDSKEGLFEACLMRTSDELDNVEPASSTTLDGIVARLVEHVVHAGDSDDPLQMLLLLRASGDESADAIRRRTLESFTQKLASSAGWSAGDPSTAHLLLRAQLAIGAMLGVLMLRTSAMTEPIASAPPDALGEPLSQALRVLLAG